MKITVFDEKERSKFKFNSINDLELRYTADPIYVFGQPVYRRKILENVEIKTLCTNSSEYAPFYDLVGPTSEVVRLKVECGVMKCDLTGYFQRLDITMLYGGMYELTMSFCVIEAGQLYVIDEFEAAIIAATTTNAAIEAAIRLTGK